MIKISLIITVYNTSEYLRRIFDSCIYQTLKDIEIIAVNDNSPNSRDSKIMREYENKYKNKFRCLWSNNENLGPGGARNMGIIASNGEYFQVIDADDYIELDMCEKMYNKAVTDGSELVACHALVLKNGTSYILCGDVDLRKNPLSYNQQVWKYLVKKSLILDNQLFFPEKTVADDCISALWYLTANKISVIKQPFYHWIRREDSFSSRYLAESFSEVILVLEKIYSYPAYSMLDKDSKYCFITFSRKLIYLAFMIVLIKKPCLLFDLCVNIKRVVSLYYSEFNFVGECMKTTNINCSPKKQLIDHTIEYICNNIGISDFENNVRDFYEQIWLDYFINQLSSIVPEYESKTYCLWGAGVFGKFYANCLEKTNLKFVITDINPIKHGTKITEEHSVSSWSDVEEHTDVILVTLYDGFESVKSELENDFNIDSSKINILDINNLIESVLITNKDK